MCISFSFQFHTGTMQFNVYCTSINGSFASTQTNPMWFAHKVIYYTHILYIHLITCVIHHIFIVDVLHNFAILCLHSTMCAMRTCFVASCVFSFFFLAFDVFRKRIVFFNGREHIVLYIVGCGRHEKIARSSYYYYWLYRFCPI